MDNSNKKSFHYNDQQIDDSFYIKNSQKNIKDVGKKILNVNKFNNRGDKKGSSHS
jgi:hypothetical protein